MALPVNRSTHLIPAYYSFIDPERLSWPSWLTCSGWFTHISFHPSAAGRAQDRESSPVRDRRSTTVLCHQLLPYSRIKIIYCYYYYYYQQLTEIPSHHTCYIVLLTCDNKQELLTVIEMIHCEHNCQQMQKCWHWRLLPVNCGLNETLVVMTMDEMKAEQML